MGPVSPFMTGNYLHQSVAVYLFANSVNLSFMLVSKSDVIKDVSSAKLSYSLVAAKVLMKNVFFAFSPFLYVFMGS